MEAIAYIAVYKGLYPTKTYTQIPSLFHEEKEELFAHSPRT